jgi:hypothetical protein
MRRAAALAAGALIGTWSLYRLAVRWLPRRKASLVGGTDWIAPDPIVAP